MQDNTPQFVHVVHTCTLCSYVHILFTRPHYVHTSHSLHASKKEVFKKDWTIYFHCIENTEKSFLEMLTFCISQLHVRTVHCEGVSHPWGLTGYLRETRYNSLIVYWIWRSTEFPYFTLKFQYSPCYVIFSKQSCDCESFKHDKMFPYM